MNEKKHEHEWREDIVYGYVCECGSARQYGPLPGEGRIVEDRHPLEGRGDRP